MGWEQINIEGYHIALGVFTPTVETQEQFAFREEIVTAVTLPPGVAEE